MLRSTLTESAWFEEPEVAASEGLFDGSDFVVVAVDGDDGEAYAVVGDALVYFEFVVERAVELEGDVGAFGSDGDDGCSVFYNT